jgi:hypothetical protein
MPGSGAHRGRAPAVDPRRAVDDGSRGGQALSAVDELDELLERSDDELLERSDEALLERSGEALLERSDEALEEDELELDEPLEDEPA